MLLLVLLVLLSALQEIERGVCELRRMLISDVFRRKGLGRRLLLHLIDHVVATAGLARVFLSTPTMNRSAIEMYEKAGFAVEAEEAFLFEPDSRELLVSTLAWTKKEAFK